MGNTPPKTKETRLRMSQLATFNEVGKALTSSLDLKEILKIVMEKIRALLHPGNWSLLLMDNESGELRFEVAVGAGSDKIRGMRLKSGEGIAGWVAKEKKPLLVRDVDKDPRYSKKVDSITNFKTRSIICVPLVARDSCLGVIELINRAKDKHFTDEDLLLLTTLADYTAIAIENAIFFEKVHELTITDDLTGLYNARYLHIRVEEEVERGRRFKYPVSMLFIDLDYFKQINDTYGHLCGSKLLKEMGQLIKDRIRTVDMAFRYGGDEFIVLMPDTSKKSARLVAEKLRKALKQTAFLKDDGINCSLTASFGLASCPEDADNKIDLVRLADGAMYSVKNNKRDGVAEA